MLRYSTQSLLKLQEKSYRPNRIVQKNAAICPTKQAGSFSLIVQQLYV